MWTICLVPSFVDLPALLHVYVVPVHAYALMGSNTRTALSCSHLVVYTPLVSGRAVIVYLLFPACTVVVDVPLRGVFPPHAVCLRVENLSVCAPLAHMVTVVTRFLFSSLSPFCCFCPFSFCSCISFRSPLCSWAFSLMNPHLARLNSNLGIVLVFVLAIAFAIFAYISLNHLRRFSFGFNPRTQASI